MHFSKIDITLSYYICGYFNNKIVDNFMLFSLTNYFQELVYEHVILLLRKLQMNIEKKAKKVKHAMLDKNLKVKELAEIMGIQTSDLSRCINTDHINKKLDLALDYLEGKGKSEPNTEPNAPRDGTN